MKCQICTLLRKREFTLFSLLAFTRNRFNVHEKITISIYTTWNELYKFSLCRKQNATFLISFTWTREVLNIYYTDKALKRDQGKTVFVHIIWQIWIRVMFSRVFRVQILQVNGWWLTEILVTIDKIIIWNNLSR